MPIGDRRYSTVSGHRYSLFLLLLKFSFDSYGSLQKAVKKCQKIGQTPSHLRNNRDTKKRAQEHPSVISANHLLFLQHKLAVLQHTFHLLSFLRQSCMQYYYYFLKNSFREPLRSTARTFSYYFPTCTTSACDQRTSRITAGSKGFAPFLLL